MTPDPDLSAHSQRERQLLRHVARYWMTTAAVLNRWLWPDLSEDAVRKILARAIERDLLARHLLRDQQPYFVLGPAGLTALQMRRPTKALGQQALLEHYGVLLACERRRCDVFTEGEFQSLFPELSQPGLSAKNLFRDSSSDPPRLGWLVVDHDKLSSRMVNKVGKRIVAMLRTDRPELRRLVLDGKFAVHIATATDGKRENLMAAFARKPLRTVPVFVESFPDDLSDFFLVNRR